jgi:ABC-type dipeptide/oligopeptide/nickel transport system permease subunit
MKSEKSSKLEFNVRRLLGFLKAFLRSKRATAGILIILFFVFIAVDAPFFTPYDNLGVDPARGGALAGKRAAPVWLRNFPTFLGGNPYLSENLIAIQNPGYPVPANTSGGEMDYFIDPSVNEPYVSLNPSQNVGYPYSVRGMYFESQNGSMALTFQRSAGTSTGRTSVYYYKEFDYPYSGVPARYSGSFELLVNGSYEETIRPEEQWYIIQIKGGAKEDSVGDLEFFASSNSGLYIAATTDITEYFRNNQTCWNQGYRSWKEWLNGTDSLPGHWDQMNWVVSEGSLANRTYDELAGSPYAWLYNDTGDVPYLGFKNNSEIADPDLQNAGDNPDIINIANWTSLETRLVKEAYEGNTTIYVESVEGWPVTVFNVNAYIVIGSNETQELCQVSSFGSGYIKLKEPLKNKHEINETVTMVSSSLKLYSNLVVPKKTDTYVLVKFFITDPYGEYWLDVKGFAGASIRDENFNYVGSRVKLFRREVRLHVPVEVTVFFGSADSPLQNATVLFPKGLVVPNGFRFDVLTGEILVERPLSGLEENQYWIISRTSRSSEVSLIDSEVPDVVAKLFGRMPGKYVFGIKITFIDEGFSSENASTTVYVDDLAFKLYGTSFGIMGTDQFGHDLFAQLIYGTRISLYIGISVSVLSILIGLIVGLAAGYMGGLADQFLMRFNDLLLVLPSLPLLIVLVAVLGARIENLIILLGLLGWNGFARVVRSQVLSIKERPFIEASKAAGAGTGHIIARHILPHVMSLTYVSLATSVPGAITTEAALSWLGFYDPNRMSWGRMLHEVFVAGATRNWWWVIPPGLCIALVATAFILLGYALDDILNPKLRVRR